jgi:hypothetical protein
VASQQVEQEAALGRWEGGAHASVGVSRCFDCDQDKDDADATLGI